MTHEQIATLAITALLISPLGTRLFKAIFPGSIRITRINGHWSARYER